jgi:ABC-2 type transport system permease protein
MQADMANGIDGHNPVDQRAKELEAKVLAQYGVKDQGSSHRLRGLKAPSLGGVRQPGLRQTLVALWDAFERQAGVHLQASVAAPFLAVRAVSMAFSGADFAHHRHFSSAAE